MVVAVGVVAQIFLNLRTEEVFPVGECAHLRPRHHRTDEIPVHGREAFGTQIRVKIPHREKLELRQVEFFGLRRHLTCHRVLAPARGGLHSRERPTQHTQAVENAALRCLAVQRHVIHRLIAAEFLQLVVDQHRQLLSPVVGQLLHRRGDDILGQFELHPLGLSLGHRGVDGGLHIFRAHVRARAGVELPVPLVAGKHQIHDPRQHADALHPRDAWIGFGPRRRNLLLDRRIVNPEILAQITQPLFLSTHPIGRVLLEQPVQILAELAQFSGFDATHRRIVRLHHNRGRLDFSHC